MQLVGAVRVSVGVEVGRGLPTSLDVIIGYACRLMRKGLHPTVEALDGVYADAVRLMKAEM